MRRAACHLADLGALETLHERRLAVDGRRAVALLSVVVIAPRVHLTTTNQHIKILAALFKPFCAIYTMHDESMRVCNSAVHTDLSSVGDCQAMQRSHRHVHDLLALESLNHLRLAHVRVAAVTQAEVVTFAPATNSKYSDCACV